MSALVPLALRLDGQPLSASVVSSSIDLDLGTILPAGTRWRFGLARLSGADYTRLTEGSSGMLQLLHPTLGRWMWPTMVSYHVCGYSAVGSSLTLPGVLGSYLPGRAGNPSSFRGLPRLDLDATLLAPSLLDAPKYYTSFYG